MALASLEKLLAEKKNIVETFEKEMAIPNMSNRFTF